MFQTEEIRAEVHSRMFKEQGSHWLEQNEKWGRIEDEASVVK